MYHFEFVSREKRAPVKAGLISVIQETQALLRDALPFHFYFVGSDRRDMVTCDPTANVGYDFDVNLELQGDGSPETPDQIKAMFIRALNRTARKYGYDYAEDSTRVITLKCKDRQNARILHSCDFAIVRNYADKKGHPHREYIHFNKKQNRCAWKRRPDPQNKLLQKAQWLKDHGYHEEMRRLYLEKKNRNPGLRKHSRSLYAEAVHETCQRHGFYT